VPENRYGAVISDHERGHICGPSGVNQVWVEASGGSIGVVTAAKPQAHEIHYKDKRRLSGRPASEWLSGPAEVE
jgi:hypothetical protein